MLRHKLILGLGVMMLMGAGCATTINTPAQNSTTQLEANVLNSETDDLRGAHSYQEKVTNGRLYTSSIYYFNLTLPETWGEINEQVSDGPSDAFTAVVKLSSVTDPDRFIEIYVVNKDSATDPLVTDLPAEQVGQANSEFMYFISGAGDNYGKPGMDTPIYKTYQTETNTIRASFKTNIN
jgi:hypothetical protein